MNTYTSQELAYSDTKKRAPTAAKYRYRVLLAEDDLDTQQFLMRLLSDAGVEVSVVDNGLACADLALESWQLEEAFDGILLDIQMPYLRGYDVVSELRNAGYPGVIIAMTAHAYLHDNERAMHCGCDAFLTKPFSVGRFLSILKQALAQRGACESNDDTQKNDKPSPSDHSAFTQVILNFLDRLPARIDEIKRAFDEQNWNDVAEYAHKLMAAEMMGFPVISEIAGQIENESKIQSKAALAKLIYVLEETCKFAYAEREEIAKSGSSPQ